MFGIGVFEMIIIAVFILIFFGPKRLPELMSQAGKFFVQMRRFAGEAKSGFDDVIRKAEDEIRKEEGEKIRKLLLEENAEGSDEQKDAHGAVPYNASGDVYGTSTTFESENIDKDGDSTPPKPIH